MAVFEKGNSIGYRRQADIADYLELIGNEKEAAAMRPRGVAGQGMFFKTAAWQHTGLTIGFIPQGAANAKAVLGLSQIQADHDLIGKQIKITLNKFYVSKFPGDGRHKILCEFAGKNQLAGDTEELRFAVRFSAGDSDSTSISGKPIFLGLTVGANGISFAGRTVNVSSDEDEILLAALESNAFKSGLALIHAVQPALKPLSSLAEAAVKATLGRRKNVEVHAFELGLDFSGDNSSARLAKGSYIVVQTNEANWNWNDYVWSPDNVSLENKLDRAQPLPYNYMIFGVTDYDAKPRRGQL